LRSEAPVSLEDIRLENRGARISLGTRARSKLPERRRGSSPRLIAYAATLDVGV